MFKKLLVCLLITAMLLPALVSCGNGISLPFGSNNIDYDELLDFYLLPDGTYGVKAGNALYLDTIVIPEKHNGKKVTKILPHAFDGATNLMSITIPDSITSIGDFAFSGCASLSSLTIPESVTRIGKYIFHKQEGGHAEYDCYRLKSITFENPNGWYIVDDYIYYAGVFIYYETDINEHNVDMFCQYIVPSIDLKDPSTAKLFLVHDYFALCWIRV